MARKPDDQRDRGGVQTKIGTSYTETARGAATTVGQPPAELRANNTGTYRQHGRAPIQGTDAWNIATNDSRFQNSGGGNPGRVIDTNTTCPVDGSVRDTFVFPQPVSRTRRNPILSNESNSESGGNVPQDNQGYGKTSVGAGNQTGGHRTSTTHVPSTPLSVPTRINQDAGNLTGKIRGATNSYQKKTYPSAPPPKPRFSMSKTTTALTNLTTSLPHVSLPSSERNHSISSIISKSSNKASTVHSAVETSNLSIGLDESNESKSDIRKSESEDASLLSHAYRSSYWLGRYVGLNDRILTQTRLSEQSMKEASELKAPARPDRNRNIFKGSIPHSNTTAALTTLPTIRSAPSTPVLTPVSATQSNSTLDFHAPMGQDEDDARFLFIMEYLRKLCVTPEARESLWTWQQAYARKEHKAALLPPGGAMADPQAAKSGGGWGRFLGGQSLIARARKTDGKVAPPGRPLGERATGLSGKVGSKARLNLFRAKMPNLG